MTLFFLRHYPTFALLGFLFELHHSNAYRDVEMMKSFLREHFPLPERVRKKISSFEDLFKRMPEKNKRDRSRRGKEKERNREINTVDKSRAQGTGDEEVSGIWWGTSWDD